MWLLLRREDPSSIPRAYMKARWAWWPVCNSSTSEVQMGHLEQAGWPD